jgi:hypothetical protein
MADDLLTLLQQYITEKKTDFEITNELASTNAVIKLGRIPTREDLIKCIRNLLIERAQNEKPLIGPLSEPPTREANPEFWRVVDSLSDFQVQMVRQLVYAHLDDVGSALLHNTDVSVLVQYLLDNHACWDELKQKLGVK